MTKTIKQILAIILTFIMIVSTMPMAFATDTPVANGTAGEGVTWELTDDGVLTISGTGAMNTDWYSPPWKDYNEAITAVVVEEGITKISDSAFCSAESLVTVSISSTVTYVTGYTFDSCDMLEEINVAEENTAYKSIDGILFTEDEKTLVMYPANKNCDKYTIPSSVTTIGKMAFESNQGINTVIIPDTVTVMEFSAFTDSAISTIIVGNGIDTIPQSCFSHSSTDSIILSDSVKTINYAAFWSSSLETLIIGSGVESIDEDILSYTDELTAIHYKGTQEYWDAISIHEENEWLNSKELHFISEDDYRDGVTPTCADGHTEGLYCELCEDYLTGEVIPAAYDHDWNNGVCDSCSEVCIHTDKDFNEKCDVCELDLEYKEVEADETNTVYIPEAHQVVIVKFTPSETCKYLIYSDNGGNDDEIDPYVAIYDSNGDEIENDDDYNNSYNFYCEFEAKAGETYYIALSSYDSEVEYDYTIEKLIEISHQPTSGEPYVELNDDIDATYQWYSAQMEDAEATDENAEAYSYNDETATYDSENGWTQIIDADGYYSSATLELKVGDTVVVEFAEGGFEYCGFWDFDAGHEGDGCEENEGILTYEFTMDADGGYTLYTNSPVAHRIYVSSYEYTVIDGETTATLKNPEIGIKYACKVTLENGDVLTSDILEYTYAIIHQPTSAEPYVELNDDTDATYQWYIAKEGKVELTDENVIAFPSEDEGPIYDAEKGWSGIYVGTAETYDCYAYFIVPLKKGETISIELSGDYHGRVEIKDMMLGGYAPADADENGKCEFTAERDGYYAVCAYRDVNGNEVFVKAYTDGYEYTAIDGETDATLQNSEIGIKYACEVTFADDTTEISKVFEKTQMLQGWILENGKWAYYENDVKVTNRWKEDSIGWCYLGADGYMLTNAWVRDSVGWCYVGADGYCVTNKWVADSVGWCYLGADGRMVTNKWVMDSVGWCYVGANGYCVTNKWVADSVGWCYLGADGYMVTNKWVKDSAGWCYVGANGYCVTNNWVQDGGKWYYLDANGHMVTGTKKIGSKTYKFASNGVWIG